MISDFFVTKLETSQVFDEKGNLSVVTKLQALPLTVVQVKTVAKDGYWAILCQLPKTAHKFWRREIRLTEEPQLKINDQIKLADVLKPGELIKVSGISKGKGFAGVVKRHHFKGVGGQTHGQSDRQRAPGSIGMRTTPGRVWKGHRMAGHMGDETVSVRNLTVISFDTTTNLLVVSGTVPGARHSLIKLSKAHVKN
ncbi:MAG: 50S ribosomal protein L3 [Candidatus Beckwithbacteria bacterium]|nr:50S ribosomal protein L3 [Candidatus Beckwithbacteria bacterium]